MELNSSSWVKYLLKLILFFLEHFNIQNIQIISGKENPTTTKVIRKSTGFENRRKKVHERAFKKVTAFEYNKWQD